MCTPGQQSFVPVLVCTKYQAAAAFVASPRTRAQGQHLPCMPVSIEVIFSLLPSSCRQSTRAHTIAFDNMHKSWSRALQTEIMFQDKTQAETQNIDQR